MEVSVAVQRLDPYLSGITQPRPTTFVHAPRLSVQLGLDVLIATETFQYTGSFKFRAASHIASSVPQSHIITASSGNFGQAMALACRLRHKACTVVMPSTSAQVKVDAVRAYGANVDLIDTSRITREGRVAELMAMHPEAYFASSHDSPLLIRGNTSLGRELAAQLGNDYAAVLVPLGGGGLCSGVVTGLREAGCRVPVYGAAPLEGNHAAESFRTGQRVVYEQESRTLADGARMRSLGQHTWEVLKDGLAGVIEVPEWAIAEGVRLHFSLANLKAEPTAALTLGALLADPARFRDQRVCLVVSGGNVDPAVYMTCLSTTASPVPIS